MASEKTYGDCDYCDSKAVFIVREKSGKDWSASCKLHLKDAKESCEQPYTISQFCTTNLKEDKQMKRKKGCELMDSLTRLSNEYEQLDVKWHKEKNRLDEKLKSQRRKIKKEEQNIVKIQLEMSKKWEEVPSEPDTILKPLSDMIGKKLNLIPEISGPFGLNCQYYMSFQNKANKTIHIMSLRKIEKNGKTWYGYVNHKKVIHPEILPNSIRHMNDDHLEVIPLPGSVKGIIKFMEKMAETELDNAKLTPEAITKFAKDVESKYNKMPSDHPLKKYYGDKPFNELLKRDQKKIIKRQRELKLGHYTN